METRVGVHGTLRAIKVTSRTNRKSQGTLALVTPDLHNYYSTRSVCEPVRRVGIQPRIK